MSADIGRITARLAEQEQTITDELIRLINDNIDPPEPLEKLDVYVRAMYVVSDEVNSFGGCFPADEHDVLCRLLVDSPVMVGHRKDRLPIGRNFHAAVVERQGRQWIKSYFYWLRSATGAETLRENIDGGIYKECSIGFTFLKPECSICGKDIRTCEHTPLAKYGKEDGEVTCHFNYRQIERVLETSLVYRGAVPATSISKELKRSTDEPKDDSPVTEQVISSPTELEPLGQYMVTPCYDGLPVLVTCSEANLAITSPDGMKIPKEIADRFADGRWPEMQNAFGYLIGMRGKERCSLDQVRRHIDGKSSPVKRLEIRLFPSDDIRLPDTGSDGRRYRLRMQKGCVTDVAGIAPAARTLGTRDGVRVWPKGKYPPQFAGYRYQVVSHQEARLDTTLAVGYYTLKVNSESGRAQLMMTENDVVLRLEVRQFDVTRLNQGSRFVADAASESNTDSDGDITMAVCGDILQSQRVGKSMSWKLSGRLSGVFHLQPIKLGERERHIFYQATNRLEVGERS